MIRVIVDDLATTAVDAVLRPADETLGPLTPETSRLDEQAGPRFAEQRRVTTPLKAGAAVVTGGGNLGAPYVLHVVIRDPESSGAARDLIRRALVSAWQRANDWELRTIASPLVGAGTGQLSLDEAARLLAETFPGDQSGCTSELYIVVEREADREQVEAIIRRVA